MLPATLAPDIKQQVLHYLGATFNFRDPAVEQALMTFLNDPENGLFKGPWLQIRRPFRPANEGEGGYFEVPPRFTPFKHQLRAWMRLHADGNHEAQSTLVTTGTGSGKTECFLYPILDDCLRRRRAGVKGIKAIVLYPMKALANDQAGRFAREILEQPQYLDEGIRVGLYVGQTDDNGRKRGEVWSKMELVRDAKGKVVGARPINDHEILLQSPPDILLRDEVVYVVRLSDDGRVPRASRRAETRAHVRASTHARAPVVSAARSRVSARPRLDYDHMPRERHRTKRQRRRSQGARARRSVSH